MADPIRIRPLSEGAGQRVDNGAGGGDDGGMDARITKLEALAERAADRLSAIEGDVAVMKVQMATKAELGEVRAEMHKGFSEMTKWIVGTAVAVSAAAITVGTFVLNNAIPKATAQAQQPTVIVVPAQQAPAAKQ